MMVALDHPVAGAIRALSVPVKLSDTPGTVRTFPPTLGQQTEEILGRDLGLETSAIA
jgi:crotonobetainyl-CoA:carnitine CoA-transferase CaiB-like acyl-CoA transferase